MIALPDVTLVETGEDSVLLAFTLPTDHPAFAGHFPGQPVLAGVVQLDWALRLGAAHFQLARCMAQDFQVKYRRICRPEVAMTLSLRLARTKPALSFEYRIGAEIASAGRIKLEAPLS